MPTETGALLRFDRTHPVGPGAVIVVVSQVCHDHVSCSVSIVPWRWYTTSPSGCGSQSGRFPRRMKCSGAGRRDGCLLGQDLADAANLGAYAFEFFFDVFVAAIDMVDAINDGLAFGNESRQNQ